MTELQHVRNHFKSFRDPNAEIFFRMDICAIRPSDSQVLDIEIDGKEHFTAIGKMQDMTRDNWLNERYGIVVHRIDYNDEIDWHKLNQFINCKPSAKKKTPYYLNVGYKLPNLYNEESRYQ